MKYSVILIAQCLNNNIFEPEKKLVRSIKSFINQTYKNKELIIIGNGCDKTRLIYEKYFSNEPSIFYFHNNSQLPVFYGGLENKAIEISTGDYILYLNQNDVLGANHLENINNNIKLNIDIDIFYYDTYNIIDDTFKNIEKNYIELRVNSVSKYSIVHKRNNILWGNGVGNDWKFIMEMVFNGKRHLKIDNSQYIKGNINYNELIKRNNIINNTNKKVAVLLHLFYIDLWDEMKKNIDNINCDVHLFVNLVEGSYSDDILNDFKNKIESNKITVLISKNIGLDIGGTLFLFDYILKNNLTFDYILKIHSKKSIHSGRDIKQKEKNEQKGEEWRKHLLEPIVGNTHNVDKVLSLFSSSRELGMIGSKYVILNGTHKWALRNLPFIELYCKLFDINYPLHNIIFIGGTMFWVRFDIFKEYFTKINPIDIINELETGAFTDADGDKKTHALERVFGLMVQNKNMKIIGI